MWMFCTVFCAVLYVFQKIIVSHPGSNKYGIHVILFCKNSLNNRLNYREYYFCHDRASLMKNTGLSHSSWSWNHFNRQVEFLCFFNRVTENKACLGNAHHSLLGPDPPVENHWVKELLKIFTQKMKSKNGNVDFSLCRFTSL